MSRDGRIPLDHMSYRFEIRNTTVWTLILLCFVYGEMQGQVARPTRMAPRYSETGEPAPRGRIRAILTVFTKSGAIGRSLTETFDRNGWKVSSLSLAIQDDGHGNKGVVERENTSYEYEKASGHLLTITTSLNEGKTSHRSAFSFDSGNKLVEERIFEPGGQLIQRLVYKYEEPRNLIAITNQLISGDRISDFGKRIFQFDTLGRVEEIVTLSKKGTVVEKRRFERNPNGFVTRETWCCLQRYSISYEYVFDTFGNWIERSGVYTDGVTKRSSTAEPETKVYRVISYFDSEN